MVAYFASLNFASLPARMPSAIAQGILWGLMALGVYITFRLLDVADLSVDGSFATGGAVTVMLIIAGWPAWAALLAALLLCGVAPERLSLAWLVACAARDPEVLWVGMDFEPVCVAYAAEAVCAAGLPNAVVVPGTGADVVRLFGLGELAQVAINFPTPFTRRRDAHLRLVALERLMEYRRVLAPGGRLRLRTDSQPLRDFALGQLEIAGYDVLWSWDDERAHLPDEPVTYYEERLVAQGARVLSVCAVPGPEPEHVEQTRSLSLVDYLPEDLDAMGYVPYGMEWTVETIRRRRH